MKAKLDHITVRIPVLRFVKDERELRNPISNDAHVGMVVYTRNCWDVGIVVEVKDGVPTKIYSRYQTCLYPDCYFPEYGAIDKVKWYDSGIRMTLAEWKQLSIDTKDAEGFYKHWKNRIR